MPGTTIASGPVNTAENDIAAALTQSLSRDGSGPMTANLPMGAFSLTNLGGIASAPAITLASATTTNILGAASLFVIVSGSTTITNFGTGPNTFKIVEFSGALQLTNSANLILPGGNINILPGAVIGVVSDASSNATVIWYTPGNAAFGLAGSGQTGQLFGLQLSNDSGGTTAIAIAAGTARDSSDVDTLRLPAALTGKVLANAWSVGSAGGFLDTGAVGNNTYHVYLIKRPDTEVVDAIASLSAIAPTLPTSYTEYRRIGSIIRAAGAIKLFTQDNDRFRWQAASVNDVHVTNAGTAAVTQALTVPSGIVVWADVAVSINGITSGVVIGLLTALDEADRAPGGTDRNFGSGTPGSNTPTVGVTIHSVKTNTSAQVRYRLNVSGAADAFDIYTFGWIDQRNRLM